MREFVLLPIALVGGAALGVIAVVAAILLLPLLILAERYGLLRLGGIQQDRWIDDLDHNPFGTDAGQPR